ncbi:uncharacterized protein LODBEIA_P35830 [Lodderomyces beijingensis]|uniref:Zinc finger PHD-type domain-containing protein n=1 Tax=Lodderomyces beijingensis TaxID=1775926 RepID=A0ABP0ZMI7_9ASCO
MAAESVTAIAEEEVLVLPSYSLQGSFLSTIDHLPSDIVRSHWLIQACNLKIDTCKDELDTILRKYQQTRHITADDQLQLYQLGQRIAWLSREAVQEASTLNNQLITHKLYLQDEIQQLNNLRYKKNCNVEDDTKRKRDLMSQLKRHYKEHPLTSQKEALEETKKNENAAAGASQKSGIKLILKIPKKVDKIEEPVQKKVAKTAPASAPAAVPVKPKLKLVSSLVAADSSTSTTTAAAATPKLKKPVTEHKKSKDVKPAVVSALPEKKLETLKVSQEQEQVENDDNERYCFCKQPSFGGMISCDQEEDCPNGEWFHYKCVGLLNKADALKYTTGDIPWYCSVTCRENASVKNAKIQEKKRRKRRRKW